MANYYFSGIGGIGMSALAQIIKAQGHNVAGSDRNYDRKLDFKIFNQLKMQGIDLVAQDGSNVNRGLKNVVVSSAIEDSNPDVKAAKTIGIPIITRASLLAEIFNAKDGIAIGGSNGKTTVTAMTGWILDYAEMDPTIMVGGFVKNHETDVNPGNARTGKSGIFVIEADESDGTIVNYRPDISVLTSISKDHKTVEELSELFTVFAKNTGKKFIVNIDCAKTSKLLSKFNDFITYSITKEADVFAQDITLFEWSSEFRIGQTIFKLNVPGEFNVSNAVAAIAVAKYLGVPDEKIAVALELYGGVRWRMDLVGTAGNVKVINDYAHNPEKIKAAIGTLKSYSKRLMAIFQPHGFGPTRFMKDELIEAFETGLSDTDLLIMPEIYYAGGTANNDISSKDIIDILKTKGLNALYFDKRAKIIDYLQDTVLPYNNILVMGARDNTLTDFCYDIFKAIK